MAKHHGGCSFWATCVIALFVRIAAPVYMIRRGGYARASLSMTAPPPPPPLLLLLLLLLPIAGAGVWLECASTMCVECHEAAPQSPATVYRWYSTGWFDCQAGSALSYTDYCSQQPLPFNATPPFSSIFSSEKEMAFGSDGGDPDRPFLVKIPFKPTNPMTAASLNVSASPSAVTLQYAPNPNLCTIYSYCFDVFNRYTASTLVHDIIPFKFTLPMCELPLPPALSVSSGAIGMSAPAGSNGLWLYIVDKRGLTFAGSITNASTPRWSPSAQMGNLSSAHAFTASSGCKYVYAVLYVATSSPSAADDTSSPSTLVDVTLNWLPRISEDYGSVLSFDYLSAEKFEFDPARIEGRCFSLPLTLKPCIRIDVMRLSGTAACVLCAMPGVAMATARCLTSLSTVSAAPPSRSLQRSLETTPPPTESEQFLFLVRAIV
jgi:hypothetical protein